MSNKNEIIEKLKVDNNTAVSVCRENLKEFNQLSQKGKLNTFELNLLHQNERLVREFVILTAQIQVLTEAIVNKI